MFGLFGKGVDKRREEFEQTLQSSVEAIRSEQAVIRHWVTYLHGEQQRLQRMPALSSGFAAIGQAAVGVAGSAARAGAATLLTEEQVRTIVEKHAAFDVLLDKIGGIEKRISGLQLSADRVPSDRLDELQRSVVTEVSRTLAASETAIADRLESELKEAETRWRSQEGELRGVVDTRLGELREELEADNERRFVMLASRVESLEKAPRVENEALDALRERVGKLEERPQNEAGAHVEAGAHASQGALSVEDQERIARMESRLENSMVKITQKFEDGDQKFVAIEQGLGSLRDGLSSTRQELLSSISAMAERVARIEQSPVSPHALQPQQPHAIQPLQHLQLPLPPAFPQPVVMQPAPIVQQMPFPAPAPSSQSLLQQKLLRRIAKHPKAVVKSAILTLIQKYGRLEGTELREMVVEEQQLCSKSSFYRLLEELEKDKLISIVGDGKEKTLLPSEHKHRKVDER